jgi:hypothetical protein
MFAWWWSAEILAICAQDALCHSPVTYGVHHARTGLTNRPRGQQTEGRVDAERMNARRSVEEDHWGAISLPGSTFRCEVGFDPFNLRPDSPIDADAFYPVEHIPNSQELAPPQ